MNSWNKRGFTLVELIITIAIVGVISLVTVQFLVPQFEIYGQYHDTTMGKYLSNTAYALLEKEFRFSVQYRIDEDSNILYYSYIDEDNKLVEKGPFTQDYLMNQEPFSSDPEYSPALVYHLDDTKSVAIITINIYKSPDSSGEMSPNELVYSQQFKFKSLYD